MAYVWLYYGLSVAYVWLIQDELKILRMKFLPWSIFCKDIKKMD